VEEKIIEMAASQGVWTVFTVSLVFYILKNQEKRDIKQDDREKKYQEIIVNLTDKLSIVEDVKKDVEEIMSYVREKNY